MEITAALYKLQDKGTNFQWAEQCHTSFQTTKKKLSSAAVLAFPSPGGIFVLDTDASEYSIGAVLSRVQVGVERLIANGTCTLYKSEKTYCATCRDLLALVYFLHHF